MKKLLARLGKLTSGGPGALLSALIMIGLVYLFSLTTAHDRLEYVFYDLRFKIKPKAEPLPELVLLNVDDPSISALGVYPWPRHYYAYILRQLKEVGLANLVFDFQFMDSSPPLLNPDGFNTILGELSIGKPILPEDLYKVVIDNDRDLAMAVAEFPGTILPYSFAKVESKLSLSPEVQAAKDASIEKFTKSASLPLPVGREEIFRALADADRVTINYPIPELMDAASSFGFVDNDADLDGAHRRVRLIRVFQDRIYLHLSLISFLRMCGSDIEDLVIEPGTAITIRNAVHPVDGQRRDVRIPVDKSCAIYFDWIGDFDQTARSVSAHALIEYPFYAEQFEMQLMLKDMVSGKSERAELSAELDTLKTSILEEKDLSTRFSLRQEYRRRLVRYQALIQTYLDESQKELEDLESRKKAGDDIDPESLASIQTLITAISIKTQVEYLFDSVAVIGLTATGTQDEGITPLSNNYWMVGSYPTAINTLARGMFIRTVPKHLEWAAMGALAIALAWFIHDRSAKIALLSIGLLVVLANGAALGLFFYSYIWIDQLSLNLALLLPSALIIVTKFAGEEEQRQFIQGAFSKYLSQDVIDRIIADPEALRLGGDSCRITTFFSDIAGFSGISEKLNAEGLVQLLNEYLSEMTDIIMGNQGTVDKYEGDAIMAFWGAPLAFPDHAYQACFSAVQMQRRLAELREGWRAQGRHELRVRMGLNTGDAVAGNMGSRTRMNYTVMGDSVNLASRLEGANKVYGTYAMVSHYTHQAVEDQFRFRELDTIRVVGKKEPITVYELIETPEAVPEKKQELLRHYEGGMALYKQRRWKDAKNNFARALKLDLEDQPSKLYFVRCRAFLQAPPPDSWDGVSNLSSK
jgi:adenylate cyclase